eukprot:GEMP01058272.1.p1 GENE.GEMP01058272.1~~GEMP01058272.1.p1  ORF type:complete len:262 (+),score=48.84 GEMP01058272.1:28-786(+)
MFTPILRVRPVYIGGGRERNAGSGWVDAPHKMADQNASTDEKEEEFEKANPIIPHLMDTGTTYLPGVGVVHDDILKKAKRLSRPELAIPKAQSMIYVAGVGVISNSALDDTARLSDAPEGSSGARLLIRTWSRVEENPASNIPYSIGSKYHPSDCKPCAYFHKEHGCSENDKCTFCHACPVGKSCEEKHSDCVEDCPAAFLGLPSPLCLIDCATERLHCEHKGKMCDACKEKCSDASIGTAFDKCLQCLDTC